MTSGGDSSGMNCAVRATVRCALARGCIPYLIFEGYQGLVDGGDKIRKAGWDDVRGLMSLVSRQNNINIFRLYLNKIIFMYYFNI